MFKCIKIEKKMYDKKKNKIAKCMKEKVMGYNLTSFPFLLWDNIFKQIDGF